MGSSGDESSPWASWDALQDALSSKHLFINKQRLRQIVNSNRNLFSIKGGRVKLCQPNRNLVREYFELAEGIEVIERQTNVAFSLSEPCHIEFLNSILVTGMVCASSLSEQGRAVVFRFGDHIAYRLEHTIKGNYKSGQKLRSVLRIRKVVNLMFKLIFRYYP